jgi:DNA polymerase-3 subunit epsilon
MTNDPICKAVSTLENHPDYRLLRRIGPFVPLPSQHVEQTFIGVVLDTETTGLDPSDEIIEIGIIKLEVGISGRIYRVLEVFNQLQQPQKPIPEEITRITGITNAHVAGHHIDDVSVNNLIKDAVLIIAHNASFDRKICEKRWPAFSNKHWACSFQQIPWREEGHEGGKLGYLLIDYGLFHAGHRAVDDCHALLHLLSMPLRNSRRLSMYCLLENARKSTLRLWAQNSPFESKDLLKSRRYHWNSNKRCWYTTIEEATLEAEYAFLSKMVYGRTITELPIDRITSLERFSERE